MIPFNNLGPVFKAFASLVYPVEFRRSLAAIIRQVPREGAVLDIGSGTGILSQFSAKTRSDLSYVMVDPAPGMLRFAPEFARKIVGAAEHLSFPDDSFDAVLAGDAFHHFGGPDAALCEIVRVLRPGGIFIVFEIDPGSFMGAVVEWTEKLFREPAHFYRPERLVQILAKFGFACRISRYGWRYSILAFIPG